MKKQDLYILAFKKDPLIKVGLAGDPSLRVAALGLDRFDLSASYLVLWLSIFLSIQPTA